MKACFLPAEHVSIRLAPEPVFPSVSREARAAGQWPHRGNFVSHYFASKQEIIKALIRERTVVEELHSFIEEAVGADSHDILAQVTSGSPPEIELLSPTVQVKPTNALLRLSYSEMALVVS